VKKQQLILASGGLVVLALLMIFGKTVEKKEKPAMEAAKPSSIPSFDITKHETEARQKLTPGQSEYLAKLENSASRGDVKDQQFKVYNQLASFWRDSLHNHELYVFYVSKAAKLVNSEKNLTFAARQILDDLRNEGNLAIRSWKAEEAISLFEKAIEQNPSKDSLKVELASCYIFGKGMAGNTEETMKGIQQLLQIVKKDSSNMEAQLALGIGGVISTQYDKAVSRLLTVVEKEPMNVEALSWLADAYAAKGDKVNALKYYQITKRLVNNPAYTKEVDERIKLLK
jgi:tetratricopeptide (TPR) repeat protein